MSTIAKTKLNAEAIKPKIGSRVLNTKEELLSGEIASDIRELLEARGVLVFPKVSLTSEEQVAFTKTLGKFAPERAGGDEEITKISLDERENPGTAEYLKGSLSWHIDGTGNDVPIFASLLTCIKPSPKGTGNTGFSNTYSAFEDLPEDKKAEYETYSVVHGPWASLFYYDPEPSLAKLQAYARIGQQELPLVWKHKSGRKSLVIGCTAAQVVGKTALESAMIIHGLRDWATGPDFTYSHEWEIGDLVMWDNTGTMHRAEPYDHSCGRMMHRTKLEGEEAFAYA